MQVLRLAPNPGDILRQALVEKIARNPNYSLRAFARQLRVSHSYLSLVLNGKRKLPFGTAIKFAQLAGMDEEQTELLVTTSREEYLRARPVTPFAAQKARPSSSCTNYRMELDRFRVISHWYHLAILDLTLIKGFKSQSRWIAVRLGISEKQVRIAIGRLRRLGLLDTSGKVWVKTKAKLEVPTHQANRAILNFHEGMIQKALEAARSEKDEDYLARDITGITMPINPARIGGAKTRIQRFRWSLYRYLSQGECTDLYQLNLQLFPLYRAVRRGNRGRKA